MNFGRVQKLAKWAEWSGIIQILASLLLPPPCQPLRLPLRCAYRPHKQHAFCMLFVWPYGEITEAALRFPLFARFPSSLLRFCFSDPSDFGTSGPGTTKGEVYLPFIPLLGTGPVRRSCPRASSEPFLFRVLFLGNLFFDAKQSQSVPVAPLADQNRICMILASISDPFWEPISIKNRLRNRCLKMTPKSTNNYGCLMAQNHVWRYTLRLFTHSAISNKS